MIFLASGALVAIAVVAIVFYAQDQTDSEPVTAPTENYVKEAIETVKEIDSDEDGIMNIEEENKYHTNSQNKDTDADGFDDKTEIINGFNPLKAGE